MVEIRRILCPIDFSEPAGHALEHAVAVARWYESAITALHVMYLMVPPQPPVLSTEFSKAALPTEEERQNLAAELRDWLKPANRAGVKTDVLIDEGNAATRILERAASLRADLIVMGTHGLSGFERLMMGSVTEKVLRKARCPVMTVPPASVTTAKVPYTRLLCPVDFSDSSLAALRFAFSLAKESDAHLTILHAFDWPPDDDLLLERFDAPEFRREVESQACRRLEALVTDEVRVWCKPATKICYGKPYRQILEVAARDQSDLVIIGVRGRNPLDLAVFGSTTNHVVRQASCPVLTIRA
jgi:nucleotide-binding universal stress UspA family protein